MRSRQVSEEVAEEVSHLNPVSFAEEHTLSIRDVVRGLSLPLFVLHLSREGRLENGFVRKAFWGCCGVWTAVGRGRGGGFICR